MTTLSPLMTIKETCDFLKVSRTTLHEWAVRRKLVPGRIGGKARYHRGDLERLARNGRTD